MLMQNFSQIIDPIVCENYAPFEPVLKKGFSYSGFWSSGNSDFLW